MVEEAPIPGTGKTVKSQARVLVFGASTTIGEPFAPMSRGSRTRFGRRTQVNLDLGPLWSSLGGPDCPDVQACMACSDASSMTSR